MKCKSRLFHYVCHHYIVGDGVGDVVGGDVVGIVGFVAPNVVVAFATALRMVGRN